MKKFIEVIEAYEIGELSGEAKIEAINIVRDIYTEDEFMWSNDLVKTLEKVTSLLNGNLSNYSIDLYGRSTVDVGNIYGGYWYYEEKEEEDLPDFLKEFNNIKELADDWSLTGVYTDNYVYSAMSNADLSKLDKDSDIDDFLSEVLTEAVVDFVNEIKDNAYNDNFIEQYSAEMGYKFNKYGAMVDVEGLKEVTA
ncbi:hypothetical protein [Abyssicoccus albus]|uniref:Uncharacterized protein n=1 Tax=Abyssicoccus albus TaxID=1817405 RepID=A0A3N5BAF7_9BACL|nr:hypothetical protein [Abyssicoccus albus]RPF54746.1 hypothetical protein EDD62_1706 [Abyssicoccus albus]